MLRYSMRAGSSSPAKRRPRDAESFCRFKLPGYLKLANLPDLEVVDRELKEVGSESRRPVGVWHDGSLTWDFIPWIRSHTRLPIFLKASSCEFYSCVEAMTSKMRLSGRERHPRAFSAPWRPVLGSYDLKQWKITAVPANGQAVHMDHAPYQKQRKTARQQQSEIWHCG